MKERLTNFVDYIKNLSKELKITYALFILGIIFILFGSVKLAFFSKSDGVKENDEFLNVNENVIENNNNISNYIDISTNAIDYLKAKAKNDELDFITNDSLYLFSVGSGKYIDIKNANKSPFGEWIYFYVAVLNDDNNGFEYYIISLDDSEQGIDFKQDFELLVEQEMVVSNKHIMTELDFKDIYAENLSLKYSNNVEEGYLLSDDVLGVKELLRLANREKLVFVSNK